MFLGDELTAVLDAIENDKPYNGSGKSVMKLGVHVLPRFFRDTTDRNRTSPFAFTGNKFEFRMLGSSNSIACANIMLNAAVAESLKIYADRLEQAEDFESALHEMIKQTIRDHKRIIFNGNGYDDAWIAEAEKRGLCNLTSTADALPMYTAKKNVDLFVNHGIYTEAEIRARAEIHVENYSTVIAIEANTMVDMIRHDILPAVSAYATDLCERADSKSALGVSSKYETVTAKSVAELTDTLLDACDKLEADVAATPADAKEAMAYSHDVILADMTAARAAADKLEAITAKEYWPFPVYSDLLFSV